MTKATNPEKNPFTLSFISPIHLGRVTDSISCKLLDFYNLLYSVCKDTPANITKKELNGFVPCIFSGNHRVTNEFVSTQILSIDIDTGILDVIMNDIMELNNKGISFICYESPSSSEEQRKFRVFLPLDKPCVSYQEYKDCYLSTISEYLPNIQPDAHCASPIQFFYIPNCSKLGSFYYFDGSSISLIPPSKERAKVKDLNIKSDESSDIRRFLLEKPELFSDKLNYILNQGISKSKSD